MTYLSLCQFVQRYLGAGNDVPSNPMSQVTGQTGYLYEIVQWVNDAYQDIQQEQSGWMFRRATGSLAMTTGTATYSKAAIQANSGGVAMPLYERIYPYRNGDAQFITIYNTALLTSSRCYYVPFEQWGGVVATSYIAATNATPLQFTIMPDESLQVTPPPSAGNSATIFYTKTIAVLTANGDIPIWPAEWHDAIAWRAIRYWSLTRENATKYKLADTEYERSMKALRASQLPDQRPTIEPPPKDTP